MGQFGAGASLKNTWNCLCQLRALLCSRTGQHRTGGGSRWAGKGSRAQFPVGCINLDPLSLVWLAGKQSSSHLPASILLCYKPTLGTGKGAIGAFLEALAWFSDLRLPGESYSTLLLMICLSSPSQMQKNFNPHAFFKVLFESIHILGSYLQYK